MQEQTAVAVQVVEPTKANDDWSAIGTVAMCIVVLCFIVPYIWLAIRRFENLHKP